jgi:hypothetical protein
VALRSAEAIYDRLLADPELVAGLGIYRRRDGTTVPAARVATTGDRLPGVERQGVELVILRFPYPSPVPLLGLETLVNPMWRLYVAQWTTADGLNRAWEVARRVIALLPGATAAPVDMTVERQSGSDMGILDQFAIRWVDVTDVVETPEVIPSLPLPEPEPEPVDPEEGEP